MTDPAPRPQEETGRRMPTWVQALLIVLFVAAAYSNITRAEWAFDDEYAILENTRVHHLNDFQDVKRIFGYHPGRFLGYLSLAVNYRLNGENPFWYRVVNVAIHAWAALAVLAILRMCLGSRGLRLGLSEYDRNTLAMLGALVFACHPVQTESVTYVVQRMEALAGAWLFTCVALYMKARLDGLREPAAPRWRRVLLYLISWLCMLAGTMTKQTAAVAPALLALMDFVVIERSAKRWRPRLARLMLYALPLLFALFVTLAIRHYGAGTRGPTTWHYLLTQAWAHVIYMRLLVWPVGLNLDYDILMATTPLDPRVIAGTVSIALALAIAWAARRKAPLVTAGILWHFIALSVTSSFIVILDVVFEHRLYPALPGFAMALLGMACLRPSGRKAARTAGLVLVITLAALTNLRNTTWSTRVSLWGDTVAKSPGKARANLNYGHALLNANRADEAIPYLQKAVRLKPENVKAYDMLGQIHALKGDRAGAERLFKQALATDPDAGFVHNNLGLLYASAGRAEAAGKSFERAVELDPRNADALNNLGMFHFSAGRFDKAADFFSRAARERRGFATARKNLGMAKAMLGDHDEAVRALLDAHRLAPERGDIAADLGRVYLLMENLPEAERWLKRALADPLGEPAALENLLALYQRTGRVEAARETAERILAANPRHDAARKLLGRP